ncbi:MAG: sigma factor [Thermomicrobiales bacterium]
MDDCAAAEDVPSADFERALKALPRFTNGSFRAWLWTIARNTVTAAYHRDRGEQCLDAAGVTAPARLRGRKS